MQRFKWPMRLLAALAALIICMPTHASAASKLKLRDFGDRALETYRLHALDLPMLKALIAVDLAEGRSIQVVDEAAVAHVAASMRLSPTATVEMYVNYYTPSAQHKRAIFAQADRLVDIGHIFSDKVFPIPDGYEAWYGDSWAAPRGEGGGRAHEGIDLAVAYGVPIRSMGSGVVEAAGWNTLGGWRVGIRDQDGLYYYYAHLASFAPGIEAGARVEAGQIIGYVGDSGYGPEGTTGLLTPHLHIGLYEGQPKSACNPLALLNWTR